MVVTGQLPATYQVRFTAWRVPCGPADHQLLFTLEPIAGTPRPLLLTIQFIQNNRQYMAFASRTPDPLLVPSTVLMEVDPPPGGGTEFDDDLGFEAVFIDAIAGIVGRLTVPAAPANGAMGALALRGAFSGSWFDANRPGQGLMLEFGRVGNTRRVAFVSWYVQINGQQAWIAGNANYDEGDTSLEVPLYRTTGGTFPNTGGPAGTLDYWGTGTLAFPACGELRWSYSSIAQGSGQITMSRGLPGGIDGLGCNN
jgi:hypothetical protein